MVVLPLRIFSVHGLSEKYLCDLKSDSKSDDKVLKRLATESHCVRIIQYKDCSEHAMKYEIIFKKTKDKEHFLNALKNCHDLEICSKLMKRYS